MSVLCTHNMSYPIFLKVVTVVYYFEVNCDNKV